MNVMKRENQSDPPEYDVILNIFKYHIEDYLCEPKKDSPEVDIKKMLKSKRDSRAFLYSNHAKLWASEINMDLDFVLKDVEKRIKKGVSKC